MSSSVLDALSGSTSAAATTTPTKNETASADRFLKLLVAQMQSQNPLNPLDNAQVTSQMAQINTVSGIEKLNTTVEGLNAQFVQLQALQGASLVGKSITLAGDKVAVENGVGTAGFELSSTAERVKVEILSPAGRVLDTLELGAQGPGRQGFEWAAKNTADGADLRFRVTATTGTTVVGTTQLMKDRVEAVNVSGERLTLETERSGRIDFSAVKAIG